MGEELACLRTLSLAEGGGVSGTSELVESVGELDASGGECSEGANDQSERESTGERTRCGPSKAEDLPSLSADDGTLLGGKSGEGESSGGSAGEAVAERLGLGLGLGLGLARGAGAEGEVVAPCDDDCVARSFVSSGLVVRGPGSGGGPGSWERMSAEVADRQRRSGPGGGDDPAGSMAFGKRG